MKNLKYIFIIFISAIAVSCTDIVQLDIPEGEKLIIINGRVTDTHPVFAQVLESAPIFSEGDNPAIEGATVLLFEDDVNVATLTQDTSGLYTSSFFGEVGKTYRIEVTVPASHPELGNTTWASKEETMKPVAHLDTIYQETRPDLPPFQDAGEYVVYEFTETPGLGDRVRIKTWKNDTLNSGGGAISVFDDEFIDGRTFTNQPGVPNSLPAIQLNGNPAKSEDHWKVEHSSISADYMQYLELLQEQTAFTGGLFDPPPALLEGNIIGITEPSKTALGFFAASSTSTLEYTVQ